MTDPNMPHRMSVKICSDCNGRGAHYTTKSPFSRLCKTCAGSGRYGYLPNGLRVAYDARQGEWVRT